MPTHAPHNGSRTLLFGFGVPGALMAATGLLFGVQQERAIFNARIVPATVIEAGPAEPRKTARGGVVYRPAVRHRYTVDGRQFESDRLYPHREHLDIRFVQALVSMYRPGQQVFTRVPQHDPGAAYLAPRRIWIWHGLLAFGLAILAGVVTVLRWLRPRTPKTSPAGAGLGVVRR